MAFNGKEGSPISLDQASGWTENYRNANPGAVKAHFFGRDILLEILNQENCMGIRIFYAQDDQDVPQLILVGSDANEADLVQGTIAEFSVPCPSICGPPNDLNS